jgi:hypothetical protein
MSVTATIPDLWPEAVKPHSSQITPRAILESQANYLTKKTEGLISGEVVVRTVDARLFHDFYLRVPRLDEYRFLMFTVVQLQHELYPVAIIDEVTHYPKEPSAQMTYLKDKIFGQECNDQQSFTERLRELFQHPRSIKIIDSLVAQSAQG